MAPNDKHICHGVETTNHRRAKMIYRIYINVFTLFFGHQWHGMILLHTNHKLCEITAIISVFVHQNLVKFPDRFGDAQKPCRKVRPSSARHSFPRGRNSQACCGFLWAAKGPPFCTDDGFVEGIMCKKMGKHGGKTWKTISEAVSTI